MPKAKFDVLVEAVHYDQAGKIAWVRGYERRGPTFSDLVLIHREDLIKRLRADERIVYGRRIPQLASTFEVSGQIRLQSRNSLEFVITEGVNAEKDDLAGVPIL